MSIDNLKLTENEKVEISPISHGEKIAIETIVTIFALVGIGFFMALGENLTAYSLVFNFLGGIASIAASILVWIFRKKLIALYNYL